MVNTNSESLRLVFHPAITCNLETLHLKHANKGNIQVEKTGVELTLQKQILLHQGLTRYQQINRSGYPTGIKLRRILRLWKMLSVQTEHKTNWRNLIQEVQTNKAQTLIFLICANAEKHHEINLFCTGWYPSPQSFKYFMTSLSVNYRNSAHSWLTGVLFTDSKRIFRCKLKKKKGRRK